MLDRVRASVSLPIPCAPMKTSGMIDLFAGALYAMSEPFDDMIGVVGI